MQTHALDLPVVLPAGPECDRCVSRLQEGLRLLKGVESAAVSGARSTLQVAFNPDMVTVSRIEEEARRIGADLAIDVQHETIDLKDIDCPDCAASIEKGVSRLPGVLWAGANFAAAQMYVEFRPDRTSVRQICRVAEEHGIRACALPRSGNANEAAPVSWWDANRRLVSTATALGLTGLAILTEHVAPVFTAFLSVAAIVAGGASTFRGAWAAMRARSLDMNVLMSIAVIGAAVIGEWTEGASVVALFSLGNLLQAGAMERTRRSIRGLLSLAPATARVRRNGTEVDLPVQEIAPGDVALVKPGGVIPLDGEVLLGRSHINQAPITGESLPVEKGPGDTVFGGTLNGNAHLELRVTRRYRDTTLARIIHRVEEAQAQRAPSQQLIDRFARIYTPVVVTLSMAVCLIPSVAVTLWDRTHHLPIPAGLWPEWFLKGLSLLIIACPCALVISTPVAVVTAIGAASRMGALVKGGAFLETIGRLRAILFDKTGTLTEARFRLVETVIVDGARWTTDHVRHIAAALELRSEHPLAAAFDGRPEELPPVEEYESLPGLGARGRVEGRSYLIGSPRLMEQAGVDTGAAGSIHADIGPTTERRPPEVGNPQCEIARMEAAGATVIALAEDGRLAALFAVQDVPRPEARPVVSELESLGIRELAVVTGDNERVARAVAESAGIADTRAGLLPDEKLTVVRQFHSRFGAVGMVGDGINDAPALATADVGFAMAAAGSDTAIETADVALMTSDLRRLPALVRLSRRMTGIIRLNIAFSLLTKAGLLIAAVTIGLPLWLAVLGDVGVSLIVTLNSLRLRS